MTGDIFPLPILESPEIGSRPRIARHEHDRIRWCMRLQELLGYQNWTNRVGS